jgi:hypothetical protein
MNHNKRFSSTIKSRFTRHFLGTLLKINRQRTRTTPSSPREIYERYLRVKIAADVSMASAVGSRRAWSRAVLAKIRQHQGRHHRHGHGGVQVGNGIISMRKRNYLYGKKCICNNAKELRKLVPGAEAILDTCSLLDETAHYIKCLTNQVKVMTTIAHQICST